MTDVLLQHGIWGVVVLAQGLAIKALYSRVQELSDKRVEDHKLLLEQYRATVDDSTKTLGDLSHALEARRK